MSEYFNATFLTGDIARPGGTRTPYYGYAENEADVYVNDNLVYSTPPLDGANNPPGPDGGGGSYLNTVLRVREGDRIRVVGRRTYVYPHVAGQTDPYYAKDAFVGPLILSAPQLASQALPSNQLLSSGYPRQLNIGLGVFYDQTFVVTLKSFVLDPYEKDKIRLDQGPKWPNPFGDSYCLVCNVLTGLWEWKQFVMGSAPRSPGYGWSLSGHNMSVSQDSNNSDLVFQDGSGSLDRWKLNQNGSYSPRFASNYSTLTKDAVSGLVKITTKEKIVMNFLANGMIDTVVDRNGNTTTYNYGDINHPQRLTSIDDGEGRVTSYVYSSPATDGRPDDGQPYKILSQDPTRSVTLGYDTNNRLASTTNAAGESTQFVYNPDGSIKQKIDPRGLVEVEYIYTNGKLSAEVHYGEQRYEYSYSADPSKGQTTVTVVDKDLTLPPDADVRTSVYNYDNRYNLIKMVDPRGNIHQWQYNDPNPYLLTRVIDPNNAPTSYEYDSYGNVTKVTDAQDNSTNLVYGQDNYLLTSIQRPPVKVRNPVSGVNTVVTYDPTTMGYDAKGNLTSVSDKLNGSLVTTTFTPGSDGRVTSVTNRLGQVTAFQYTAKDLTQTPPQNKGNLAQVTLPYDSRDPNTGTPNVGRSMKFTYDQSDNRTSVKDNAGNQVTYQFDAVNRLKSVIDATQQANHIDYSYLNGLLDYVSMPSVNDMAQTGQRRKTSYVRDNPGRVTQVISDKSSSATEMRVKQLYDGRSNLRQLTRLQNAVEKPAMEFDYDVLNRPVSQKRPHGTPGAVQWDLSSISYDPYCKNYTTKSARGIETEISRDSLCRVSQISNSDETRTFEYDELGRLVTSTQVSMIGARWVDPANLPADHPPARWGQARYDGASVTEVTRYFYDELDRLTQVTYPGNKTVLYEYDAEGRVTKMTDVQGTVTAYSYLNDGKLYQVTVQSTPVGQVATPTNQVFTYSYDLAGRIAQIQYPASTNIVAEFTDGTNSGWNANGQLLHLRYRRLGVLLRQFDYAYDASGNRKQMVDTDGSGSTTWDYTYDWFNRLVGVNKNGNFSSTYVYDESDNRIEAHFPGVDENYNYDLADRLLGRTVNGASETFQYDPDGNMIARVAGGQTTNYAWDSFNKLTAISGTNSQSFSYDSKGIRKSTGSDTRSYSSGSMSLADLKTAVPTNSISWIQGHALLGLVRNGAFFWYLKDGLSSVRLVVNSSGTVVVTADYDEFGRQTGTGIDADLKLHSYTGGVGVRNEQASSLYYARQRWMDPSLGRWLNEDPIGFAGGLNLYAYVGQNPTNGVDPSGLDEGDWWDVGANVDAANREADLSIYRGDNFSALGWRTLAVLADFSLARQSQKVGQAWGTPGTSRSRRGFETCMLALGMVQPGTRPVGSTSFVLHEMADLSIMMEHEIVTAKGIVGTLANVNEVGSQVVLSDIAMFSNAGTLTGLTREMLQVRTDVAINIARAFPQAEQLVLQAIRLESSSSANPGKTINQILNLGRYR